MNKKETVVRRRDWAVRQYIYVAVLYVGFAVFCFYVPELWDRLSASENRTESSKGQDYTDNLEKNTISIDTLKNGKDTVSGNSDTAVCHTPGRE